MITGKTIAQLDLISPATNNLSIPVDDNGSTYRIQFQQITDKINSQGNETVASGISSHAEGNLSASLGDYSHSEGFGSVSVGESSHAEGNQTTSVGMYSHSEGSLTTSTGEGSHAEGLSTNSLGVGSHAEGNTTTPIGYYSHTEGYNTISGWRGYNVVSTNGNVVSLDSGGIDISTLFTSGKLLMDSNLYTYSSAQFNNPYFNVTVDKSLLYSNVSQIDYSPIDSSGFDIIYTDGDDVMVEVSFPEGIYQQFFNSLYGTAYVCSNAYLTFGGGSSRCCFNEPQDIPSVVGFPGVFLGINGTDGLLYNLYTGYTNTGTSFVIRFEGSYRNIPSEPADLIFNFVFPLATLPYFDIVIESNPYSTGNSGVSDGVTPSYLATFTGNSQTSFRILTGNLSFTSANDLNNITNTNAPITNSNFAHAEGFNTKSLGRGSHSEGGDTIAIGQFSHSEGSLTTAIGYGSHTQGLGTVATGDYQNVMGRYNTTGNTTSLVVVGNGIGDTSRSDIVLVETTGVTINGTLKITGINEYANNTAALAAGLVVGNLYRTGDDLKIVH
jgi:hypothetical protein